MHLRALLSGLLIHLPTHVPAVLLTQGPRCPSVNVVPYPGSLPVWHAILAEVQVIVGLDKKQIGYMKKQNSRWCTVFKNSPQCYMVERQIRLLNIHDDSSEDEKLVKAKRKHRQPQELEEEKAHPVIV